MKQHEEFLIKSQFRKESAADSQPETDKEPLKPLSQDVQKVEAVVDLEEHIALKQQALDLQAKLKA